MKPETVRLLKEPNQSFIYYKEQNPFTPWHHHPEYELCLITKGKGKRMVGDSINRFKNNDLVFIGAYTPHECLCDPEYFDHPSGFCGEGIVIQFVYNFLGEDFFDIPENRSLKKFILESTQGYELYGETKRKLIPIIRKMEYMNDSDRMYELMSIFRIFSKTSEYKNLSSPAFNEPFWIDETGPMQKSLKYILQNFQRDISVKDLLKVTNMSNTSFYATFKKTYRMPFKDYLLKIRVGYACKLLTEGNHSVSSAAFNSGFENISNFNRQFKKIKRITPSEFQYQVATIEKGNKGSLNTWRKP